jgi:hypothetical protein
MPPPSAACTALHRHAASKSVLSAKVSKQHLWYAACGLYFATYKVRPLLLLSIAVVGPGYYLKGPGQVAPCPRGEWKAGIGSDGNCTRCALGVTTLDIAASSELNCTSGSFAPLSG